MSAWVCPRCGSTEVTRVKLPKILVILNGILRRMPSWILCECRDCELVWRESPDDGGCN